MRRRPRQTWRRASHPAGRNTRGCRGFGRPGGGLRRPVPLELLAPLIEDDAEAALRLAVADDDEAPGLAVAAAGGVDGGAQGALDERVVPRAGRQQAGGGGGPP